MTFVGILAFLFIGMTILNRIGEGMFGSLAEITTLNNLVVFREVSVFGLFTLPVPNMNYITQGLPHLVQWDYSFFGGSAALIQMFLYSLTVALGFVLFGMIIGLLYQYFGRAK
jgi:hypothetical protein